MAKKPDQKALPPPAGKGRGQPQKAAQPARRGPNLVLSAIIFVIVMWLALPQVLILAIGMLPTWVAVFLVDQSKEKYASFCVGGLNFCGTLPFLIDVWTGANTTMSAVLVLTDVFSLLIMYGAAAIGWTLFMFVPPFAAMGLHVLNERKIAQLRERQKKLIEDWGDGVTEPIDSPEEKARKKKQKILEG